MHKIPNAAEWCGRYRAMLLDDVMPFWSRYSPDAEHGGFLTYLDRDGKLLSSDKAVWLQGRAVWMYAQLYNTVEQRPEWLKLSDHGLKFLDEHCYDQDGRMFFSVTREGKPLRKRRYLFSETFAIIGMAENAVAHRDSGLLDRAIALFDNVCRIYREPDATAPPKLIPETRQLRGHSMPMILLATARTLRSAIEALGVSQAAVDRCNEMIRSSAGEVRDLFYKPELNALVEHVLPDGGLLDTPEGRVVNPGHAIETSWFLLEEAREQNDAGLQKLGLAILRDSLRIGWDSEFGGILYFVDLQGLPPDPIEHDMKLWWPHCEALYATLLAYAMTGDADLLEWHEKVREWTLAHFPDPEFGEWYGYLLRDGSPSKRVKGNMWKGTFHIPRALLRCWKLLEEIK